ncbi:MAG: hypothetical protein LBE38_02975 [Deltaproteobacteria bacterium]|jgi:DNA-binding transcriptional regulator YiaG|nr:hypothetical protein [Deltaproteobacteria bacterium]
MEGNFKSSDIKALRRSLTLNIAAFSSILGVNPITFYRWEQELPQRFKPSTLQILQHLLLDLEKKGHVVVQD